MSSIVGVDFSAAPSLLPNCGQDQFGWEWKEGSKCEPLHSMFFIVAQDVQESPHLNLTHLTQEPPKEAKLHLWGKDGLLQEQFKP